MSESMNERELAAALTKIKIISPDMYGAVVNIVKGFLRILKIKV